jgi:hypothetical protein
LQLVEREPEELQLLVRCAQCSEEVIGHDARCIYCGTRLSDPLATTTVARTAERKGTFSEDTPGSFIIGSGPGGFG